MARYIDAEKAVLELQKFSFDTSNAYGCGYSDCLTAVEDVLNDLPTTDVAEMKHGYWIDKPTGRYCHVGSWCSVCQEKSGIGRIEINRHKPYCPNCGARMDGIPKERGGEK